MSSRHAPTATGRTATLRRDLDLAVRLALAAAGRLESVPRDAGATCLYRVAFGHDPGRRLRTAARFPDAGARTAHQLRKVAAALGGGRMRFVCRAQPPAHPNRNAAVPRMLGGRTNRDLVWLYPRYWSRTRPVRAGVLIHETLHLCCAMGDGGTAPRRRLNAHCYEWLALELNGLAGGRSDFCSCRLAPP